MTTRLIFTSRAVDMACEADDWWRANRPSAVNLFVEEFERATSLIAQFPRAGTPYKPRSGRGVRRMLMRQTGFFVYYRHAAGDEDSVTILSVWSGHRGNPPDDDL